MLGADEFVSKQTPVRELLIRIHLLMQRYSEAGSFSSRKPVMEGSIEVVGAPGLLQMWHQGRLSGVCTVRAGTRLFEARFREGEIVSAASGEAPAPMPSTTSSAGRTACFASCRAGRGRPADRRELRPPAARGLPAARRAAASRSLRGGHRRSRRRPRTEAPPRRSSRAAAAAAGRGASSFRAASSAAGPARRPRGAGCRRWPPGRFDQLSLVGVQQRLQARATPHVTRAVRACLHRRRLPISWTRIGLAPHGFVGSSH